MYTTEYFNMPIEDLIKYLHTAAQEDNAELYNADTTIKIVDNKQDKIISLTLINNTHAYMEIFRYSFFEYPSLNTDEKRYKFDKDSFTIYSKELQILREVI